MLESLAAEIAALPRLRVSELRVRFAEVCGEPTPSHNKVWLVKRIAWRLQARAEGDLSERARRRAAELAADADLRLSAPAANAEGTKGQQSVTVRIPVDDRLPRPGTILTRRYKGRTLQVEVLEHGFAFEGRTYRSLSAVAKAVTGSHCSGNFFFGLTEKGKNS
jgi:Protein of unknown function (DUF2924)